MMDSRIVLAIVSSSLTFLSVSGMGSVAIDTIHCLRATDVLRARARRWHANRAAGFGGTRHCCVAFSMQSRGKRHDALVSPVPEPSAAHRVSFLPRILRATDVSPLPARATQCVAPTRRSPHPSVNPTSYRSASRASHGSHADVVVLLDCDNTLLDNDALAADLRAHIEREYGLASRDRYWAILEEMRGEEGYGDYIGALRRFWFTELPDPRLLLLSSFILGYPFADLLYPGALDAVAHLHGGGLPVILSDGNVVFQSWKIQRSGLWQAVSGRVLIYVHKEHMLQLVEETFPATHYIMVDDKPRILSAMKDVWGARLTTVAVHQGHNAIAAEGVAVAHPPDVTLGHIGDLARSEIGRLIGNR